MVWYGYLEGGFERRLLATRRWHVATAVAFPQKSESVAQPSKKTPALMAGVFSFARKYAEAHKKLLAYFVICGKIYYHEL